MMKAKILLLIMFLVSSGYSVTRLISPVDVAVESLNGTYISPVGPGNEVVLKFQRKTEEGIYWDKVQLLNKIDPDWNISSSVDPEYIYYIIKVPSKKQPGDYPFRLRLLDEEGLMRPEEALIKISVTNDPSKLIEVEPLKEKPVVFADEEGTVTLKIKNKALSVASYQVEWQVIGLPLSKKTVSIRIEPDKVKEAPLSFRIPSEGIYKLEVNVSTPDNPKIREMRKTQIFVKPTINSKLRSIGEGFPLIPLTMAPFYAVLGLFGF